MRLFVGVDVGGTFTDLAVSVRDQNRLIVHKVPSTPDRPDRAVVNGIVSVLRDHGFAAEDIVRLAHGTTVGMNALIQRRCGKIAVVTTAGFRDLLEIGRQVRPRVYDVHLDNPAPLVPRELRFEVRERRLANGTVHIPLDEEQVRAVARRLSDEGVDAVAVCFLHSYAYPEHEERAVEIFRQVLGADVHISASASVYPEFREYERFSTAVLNCALQSAMEAYLERLTRAVHDLGVRVNLEVSQSSGGLMSVEMARQYPLRAVLSGPAAGVTGAAARGKQAGYANIITLDVGGTSTDVSLLSDSVPSIVYSRSLAGFPLRLPALDVTAVGAGGGSIAWIDHSGLLKVGPDSAGADPGPACYGKGGQDATVTDANVVLGRLNGEALLDGHMPIHRHLAEQAVVKLARQLGLDPIETAVGIVRVASASIVKAIRTISVGRGHDPACFSLFVFGGAGPLHAVEVARELGIKTVIVPPTPGILCAEGLLSSDLATDFVKSMLSVLSEDSCTSINRARAELLGHAKAWFHREGVPACQQELSWVMEFRYVGQNFELSRPIDDVDLNEQSCRMAIDSFHEAHERAYGQAYDGEQIEIVNLKLRATGRLEKPPFAKYPNSHSAAPVAHRDVVFYDHTRHRTPIYRRAELPTDQRLDGPAVVEQLDATTILFPGDSCVSDAWGNLMIRIA